MGENRCSWVPYFTGQTHESSRNTEPRQRAVRAPGVRAEAHALPHHHWGTAWETQGSDSRARHQVDG